MGHQLEKGKAEQAMVVGKRKAKQVAGKVEVISEKEGRISDGQLANG